MYSRILGLVLSLLSITSICSAQITAVVNKPAFECEFGRYIDIEITVSNYTLSAHTLSITCTPMTGLDSQFTLLGKTVYITAGVAWPDGTLRAASTAWTKIRFRPTVPVNSAVIVTFRDSTISCQVGITGIVSTSHVGATLSLYSPHIFTPSPPDTPDVRYGSVVSTRSRMQLVRFLAKGRDSARIRFLSMTRTPFTNDTLTSDREIPFYLEVSGQFAPPSFDTIEVSLKEPSSGDSTSLLMPIEVRPQYLRCPQLASRVEWVVSPFTDTTIPIFVRNLGNSPITNFRVLLKDSSTWPHQENEQYSVLNGQDTIWPAPSGTIDTVLLRYHPNSRYIASRGDNTLPRLFLAFDPPGTSCSTGSGLELPSIHNWGWTLCGLDIIAKVQSDYWSQPYSYSRYPLWQDVWYPKAVTVDDTGHFRLHVSTSGSDITGVTISYHVPDSGFYESSLHYIFHRGFSRDTETYKIGALRADSKSVSLETDEGFEVYPNPTRGSLFIMSASSGSTSAQLLDCLGRTVLCQSINPGVNRVEVSALSKGLYYVKVSAEAGERPFRSWIVVE